MIDPVKRHYNYIQILWMLIESKGTIEDIKEELLDQMFEIGTELGYYDVNGDEIKCKQQ